MEQRKAPQGSGEVWTAQEEAAAKTVLHDCALTKLSWVLLARFVTVPP